MCVGLSWTLINTMNRHVGVGHKVINRACLWETNYKNVPSSDLILSICAWSTKSVWASPFSHVLDVP